MRSGRAHRLICVSVACAAVVVLATASGASAAAVTVSTSMGDVVGDRSGGVDAFKGIRYGVVPARFDRPTAFEWQGSYDASEFGPVCMQAPASAEGQPMSEDCLFLNVWTPQGASEQDSPRPVMLWIHGGAFVGGSGSSPSTDGSNLAQSQDVIVVTINYRLDVLGNFVTDEDGTGGLNFVLDQILALEWVAEHISSFGGDPDRVTIFGESAGSLSVCMIVVSPLAAGLFDRAILESGACTGSAWGVSTDTVNAFEFSQYFMRDIAGASSVAELQDTDKYPEGSLLYSTILFGDGESVPDPPQGVTHYSTVVDGYVLPEAPRLLFEAGALNVEAVMIGATTFDGLLPWAYDLPEASDLWTIDNNPAFRFALSFFFGARAGAVASAYRVSLFDGNYQHALVAASGDHDVLCPSWTLATAVAKHLPDSVYTFVFAHLYASDKSVQVGLATVGETDPTYASHASEIVFVFGNEGSVPFTEEERDLSNSIMEYWASFAAGNAPTSPTAAANGGQEWPSAVASLGPGDLARVENVHMLKVQAPSSEESFRQSGCDAFAEVWHEPLDDDGANDDGSMPDGEDDGSVSAACALHGASGAQVLMTLVGLAALAVAREG